jgi:phosphoserine phosphatase
MRGEANEDQILDLVSRTFGYPKETLREDLAESCRAMTLLSDEILPLIAKIRKKGILCVIATDNMDVFRKYVVPALKLDEYFNETLVSYNQKALKFDTSEDEASIPFFHDYLKKNGLAYTDALLLDDRIDTSGLYKKLGFDTFQVEKIDGLLEKLRTLSV